MGNLPVVARASLHKWEEPCISGTNGSGTVFFSGCNMKCVFCQNYEISHGCRGREITVERLGSIYLELQEKGAHNINLVTPSHYVPQIVRSLEFAGGLKIPVIYNSSGYDSEEALKMLEGLVDVYLPDLKYFDQETSLRYSGARDYFDVASKAVKIMYEQVGEPVFDENGIIKRGLIVRHMILPGRTAESMKILKWIKENLPPGVFISLMSQYTPCRNVNLPPEINRRITKREYNKVLDYLFSLGLENGYVQELDSADEKYIPDFNLEGV